ncbi:putative integral membrane protein [Beutenbergia cavernae DSM 12333]|uniref:Putative integral membrane protein n=1 Tax=Beutenbergia cavernae (strain ATCC BAA-8 / DSM 12333 / CCUG 43141 / JCM 11478 / NBRC 16432 / NCIMB 13614 / HKI 0122) TaxID=471853 RepID=C5C142_BEUC1|nr:lysylphosphatidylglycerol synthase domain-containing protein [Beutenbergia cavernae]ACQ79446.1 putative integral membrane protein [Beutenbergia cavernae DSM 12333]
MSRDVSSDAVAQPEASPPEKPATSTRSRILNVVRIVLVVAVVVVAFAYLRANWAEVQPRLAEISPWTILMSLAAVTAGILCGTMSWQVLVDDLGKPIGVGRGAQIFLVGQLGKYLPGSVWAYVLQLELGRRAGLARARVFAATVFSLAVAIGASLVASALAVPEVVREQPDLSWMRWLYLLLPVVLVLLHPKVLTAAARVGFKILRRPRPDHPVSYRTVITSFGWALGSYVCYGTHMWNLARSSGVSLGFDDWLLCVGVMAAAMLVGVFAFLLPSGAGVRELVIVAALSPVVGVGAAAAYAAVSRLLFTIADLGSAGISAGMGILATRRLGHYHGDPGID